MSPVVARVLRLPIVSPTAVVQAEYEGTCFVADVNLEISATDCDLVVGKEWVALLRLVNADCDRALRSRAEGSDSPFEAAIDSECTRHR